MKRLAWILFCIITPLALFPDTAKAQVTVSTSVKPGDAGGYRYDYTITNVGSTAIWTFNIAIGETPSATTSPDGWEMQVLTSGDKKIVQWVAVSQASDLQPSTTASGFSVTSSRSPGMVFFNAIDEGPNIYDGEQTIGPAFAPSQIANISTRLLVQTGSNVLIGGFIITGTQTKKILLRGIGPSLATAGLSNFLADPVLELYDSGGQTIAYNDNWNDSPAEADIVDSTIAPSDSKEAAIAIELGPEAYTVILRDANANSGIGLVEVYDLNRLTDSKLANISTRGFVNAGNNVMIGGTIILGNTSTRTLVRAIGPSLGAFGVSNPLLDPMLELHDGNGALIRANDDWRSTQESDIIATTIPPTDDRESAILATLVPGAYTAVVAGKNNSTGVALVEAYQLQ